MCAHGVCNRQQVNPEQPEPLCRWKPSEKITERSVAIDFPVCVLACMAPVAGPEVKEIPMRHCAVADTGGCTDLTILKRLTFYTLLVELVGACIVLCYESSGVEMATARP